MDTHTTQTQSTLIFNQSPILMSFSLRQKENSHSHSGTLLSFSHRHQVFCHSLRSLYKYQLEPKLLFLVMIKRNLCTQTPCRLWQVLQCAHLKPFQTTTRPSPFHYMTPLRLLPFLDQSLTTSFFHSHSQSHRLLPPTPN